MTAKWTAIYQDGRQFIKVALLSFVFYCSIFDAKEKPTRIAGGFPCHAHAWHSLKTLIKKRAVSRPF